MVRGMATAQHARETGQGRGRRPLSAILYGSLLALGCLWGFVDEAGRGGVGHGAHVPARLEGVHIPDVTGRGSKPVRMARAVGAWDEFTGTHPVHS